MKVLIFAGTAEGHSLFDELRGHGLAVHACVATDYAKNLMGSDIEQVVADRMTVAEMVAHIRDNGFQLVVDATHPYAVAVTENIRAACTELSVEYLRLLRQSCAAEETAENVHSFGTLAEAVDFLAKRQGRILSTIGSKELPGLCALADYGERVVARLLPMSKAIAKCEEMGFSKLVCMQGPFSYEMNLAMLRQYDCKFLLTKDTGAAGGFAEKLQAAKAAGAEVVIIDRPTAETGYSYQQIKAILLQRCGIAEKKPTRFPLFIDIEGKDIVVIGGGTIATRRIKTLCGFACRVKVIAKQLSAEAAALAEQGIIEYHCKSFEPADIEAAALVVAATDDRAVNHLIGALAKTAGIPVSVADAAAECTFFFPAIINADKAVIGVAGDGSDHKAVAQTAAKIREMIEK